MHPLAGLGARTRSPPSGSVFQRASETLPGYIKNLLQPPQVPKRKARRRCYIIACFVLRLVAAKRCAVMSFGVEALVVEAAIAALHSATACQPDYVYVQSTHTNSLQTRRDNPPYHTISNCICGSRDTTRCLAFQYSKHVPL